MIAHISIGIYFSSLAIVQLSDNIGIGVNSILRPYAVRCLTHTRCAHPPSPLTHSTTGSLFLTPLEEERTDTQSRHPRHSFCRHFQNAYDETKSLDITPPPPPPGARNLYAFSVKPFAPSPPKWTYPVTCTTTNPHGGHR